MVTGIASDFNQLLLSISSQAQQALRDKNPHASREISAELNSAMESSRHSHDLIVKMLAYQSASPNNRDRSDLSEATEHTFSLLRQSIAAGFQIEHRIESDIHAAERDVIELQKLLIQLFQLLCDSLSSEAIKESGEISEVLAELKMSDYHEQRCACCEQKIDGQYLELALASSKRANATNKSLLLLANKPADDPLIRSQTSALHDQLSAYNGHIMLQDIGIDNLDWRLLIPIKNGDDNSLGIRLDNSVQLEKYRQRKRERKH